MPGPPGPLAAGFRVDAKGDRVVPCFSGVPLLPIFVKADPPGPEGDLLWPPHHPHAGSGGRDGAGAKGARREQLALEKGLQNDVITVILDFRAGRLSRGRLGNGSGEKKA